MTIRLAVAADNEVVAAHFGRCQKYIIFDILDNEIVSRQTLTNPGHEPGFLPEYLHGFGVTCLITGGMGNKAKDLFNQKNIDLIVGVEGNIEEVVSDFLSKKLAPGIYGNTCDHG